MNDTISLLLATTILAIGGLGMYMYKSNDEQKGGEDYSEDNIFGSGNLWGSSNEEEDPEYNDEDGNTFYEPTVRTRGGKTKRNRKSVGTKRRYYK
jgi:hypothetical protein